MGREEGVTILTWPLYGVGLRGVFVKLTTGALAVCQSRHSISLSWAEGTEQFLRAVYKPRQPAL